MLSPSFSDLRVCFIDPLHAMQIVYFGLLLGLSFILHIYNFATLQKAKDLNLHHYCAVCLSYFMAISYLIFSWQIIQAEKGLHELKQDI